MKKSFYISFLILFSLISCELNDPNDYDINKAMHLNTDKNQLLANGVDKALITLSLEDNSQNDLEVTFKTDYGMFKGITVESNAKEYKIKAISGKTEVYLVSTNELAEATVTATVSGYSVIKRIPFIKADPERLILSSNALKIKADGQSTLSITAELITKDDIGIVTKKTRVKISVFEKETGILHPEFEKEGLTDSSGKITFNFQSLQEGTFSFIASVNNLNPVVSDTIDIKFE